jgi:CcmD family protein
MPALPLHEAGKYVAAAYVVVFVLVLVYVAVIAVRVGRMQRQLGALLAEHRRGPAAPAASEPAPSEPGPSEPGSSEPAAERERTPA